MKGKAKESKGGPIRKPGLSKGKSKGNPVKGNSICNDSGMMKKGKMKMPY